MRVLVLVVLLLLRRAVRCGLVLLVGSPKVERDEPRAPPPGRREERGQGGEEKVGLVAGGWAKVAPATLARPPPPPPPRAGQPALVRETPAHSGARPRRAHLLFGRQTPRPRDPRSTPHTHSAPPACCSPQRRLGRGLLGRQQQRAKRAALASRCGPYGTAEAQGGTRSAGKAAAALRGGRREERASEEGQCPVVHAALLPLVAVACIHRAASGPLAGLSPAPVPGPLRSKRCCAGAHTQGSGCALVSSRRVPGWGAKEEEDVALEEALSSGGGAAALRMSAGRGGCALP